jgi:hypothetical protein
MGTWWDWLPLILLFLFSVFEPWSIRYRLRRIEEGTVSREFTDWTIANRATFKCPCCGDYKFGSTGYPPNMQRHCHGRECRFTWPAKDDPLYFYVNGRRFGEGGAA